MIYVRRANERGHLVGGGMEAWESFSDDTPSWHDGFRSLALLDECTLAPRTHFSRHRHWDDEVISYLLQGSLTHTDSLGNTGAVGPGDVQIMSGGSGIFHEEWVPIEAGVTKLYQIMIRPYTTGLPPRYEARSFPPDKQQGQLRLLVSPDGGTGSLPIYQDVLLYDAQLEAGFPLRYDIPPGRALWLQVIQGTLDIHEQHLSAGDGAALIDESNLTMSSDQQAVILLFDLG